MFSQKKTDFIFNSRSKRNILNFLYSIAGLFIFQFTNGLAILLIARKISNVEYGQFVSIKAFANILFVFANFGLDSWFLANANFLEDYKIIWTNILKKKVFLHIVFFLSSFILVLLFFDKSTYPIAPFIILGVSFLIDSILQSIFTFQRVEEKFNLIFLEQTLYSISLLLIVIIIPRDDSAFLVFSFFKLFISLLILFYSGYGLFKDLELIKNFVFRKPTSVIFYYPFYFADVASIIYEKIDVFLISLFIGVSGSMVYGPAINIIYFSFFLPTAISFVILPNLTKQYKLYENRQENNFLRNSIIQFLFQLFGGVFVFIFLLSYSEFIIKLIYGETYISSAQILEKLAVIPLIKYINFGLGVILTASKNQTVRTKIMLVSAILNLLFNLLLINLIGLEGAVISYIISESVLMIFYFIFDVKIIWRSFEYSNS